MYRTQQVGAQDLAERNLVKVSLDYYIQGFCLTSMTLRRSTVKVAVVAAPWLATTGSSGCI